MPQSNCVTAIPPVQSSGASWNTERLSSHVTRIQHIIAIHVKHELKKLKAAYAAVIQLDQSTAQELQK